MQRHTLHSTFKRKPTKRVGRGGKRGTYSGGGEKGQRKRAGHRIRPASRDIILKFPKLRGIKNKTRKAYVVILNVDDLERLVGRLGTAEVSREALIKKGILREVTGPVKILGNGEVKIKVSIKGIPVSKEARKKIEKAGGTVA